MKKWSFVSIVIITAMLTACENTKAEKTPEIQEDQYVELEAENSTQENEEDMTTDLQISEAQSVDVVEEAADENTDEFTGYTDEELCRMALDYYEELTGEASLNALAQQNEDGTVSIQLYYDTEEKITTMERYTVDRVTAVGTNFIGDAIDLK